MTTQELADLQKAVMQGRVTPEYAAAVILNELKDIKDRLEKLEAR